MSTKRDRTISFKVSEEEYDSFNQEAERLKIKPSDLGRKKCFAKSDGSQPSPSFGGLLTGFIDLFIQAKQIELKGELTPVIFKRLVFEHVVSTAPSPRLTNANALAAVVDTGKRA